MKLVKVDWLDSCVQSGWQSPSDTYEPSKCTTVGILQKLSKDLVAVSLSISDSGGIGDVIIIPRKVVTSIKRIKLEE